MRSVREVVKEAVAVGFVEIRWWGVEGGGGIAFGGGEEQRQQSCLGEGERVGGAFLFGKVPQL